MYALNTYLAIYQIVIGASLFQTNGRSYKINKSYMCNPGKMHIHIVYFKMFRQNLRSEIS